MSVLDSGKALEIKDVMMRAKAIGKNKPNINCGYQWTQKFIQSRGLLYRKYRESKKGFRQKINVDDQKRYAQPL